MMVEVRLDFPAHARAGKWNSGGIHHRPPGGFINCTRSIAGGRARLAGQCP